MDYKWIMSEEVVYESDNLNTQLKYAYWEGHRDFAYDLINFVKPEQIVELGSQYGCSLFAFCQSVKDNNLNTKINAVDFWRGDIGAVDDGEQVFELVKKTIHQYYNELQIRLFQMDFDFALEKFGDESIDIIHIDGGHRFQDVENDLTHWLPKLKKNGIILFHDVFSHIDEGSCLHWKETKKKYNCYFEFKHSCGLGILFPKGDKWYIRLKEAGFLEKYKEVYYYRALYKYTKNRFDQLSELYKDRYTAIEKQSQMIDERDQTIEDQKKLIDEKDIGIKNQSRMIDERDQTIENQRKLINEKDEVIRSQTELIDEKDEAIRSQTKLIDERDQTIESQKNLIDEKDEAIRSQAEMIDERDQTIDSQKKLIDEKDEAIRSQTKLIDERDQTIEGQKKLIDEKDEAIRSQTKLIDERNQMIEGQKGLIDEKDEAARVQIQMINERNQIITDLSNKLEIVNNHKILSKIIFH